jgi:hypothetical protein
VNLDASWSREPITISHNLDKVRRALQIAHDLGMRDPPISKLGPWYPKDDFGTGVAVIMVKHSLDPGVMEDTVQYETVRKMKSAFVNMYHASVENKETAIIRGKYGKKLLVLGAPVYHEWYDRAQVGMHHRMGDNVAQNYGLSKQAVATLQVVLERNCQAAGDSREKKMGVAQLACFVFFGYARALRDKGNSKD